MELLDGEPFDQLIDDRRAARRPRRRRDRRVCEALEAAHAGRHHPPRHQAREPVPGRPRRGRPYVKLLDFGIAKLAAMAAEATPQTARASVVVGTPDYMAPEQARGQAISPDRLYSLGCVLFELLTGKRTFKGDGALQAMFMHVDQVPVPPSMLNPQVQESSIGCCCTWSRRSRRIAQAPRRRARGSRGAGGDGEQPYLPPPVDPFPASEQRLAPGQRSDAWHDRRPDGGVVREAEPAGSRPRALGGAARCNRGLRRALEAGADGVGASLEPLAAIDAGAPAVSALVDAGPAVVAEVIVPAVVDAGHAEAVKVAAPDAGAPTVKARPAGPTREALTARLSRLSTQLAQRDKRLGEQSGAPPAARRCGEIAHHRPDARSPEERLGAVRQSTGPAEAMSC